MSDPRRANLKPNSEREKTFRTVMGNLKLRVMLDRRKKEIERDKMIVVNRITLNQRITYKRFKRKLTQVNDIICTKDVWEWEMKDSHPSRGIPMGMGTKLLKLMGMGRESE